MRFEMSEFLKAINDPETRIEFPLPPAAPGVLPDDEVYFHEAEDRCTGLLLEAFPHGCRIGAGISGVEAACFFTWEQVLRVRDELTALHAAMIEKQRGSE
jgi:hypothetical protein